MAGRAGKTLVMALLCAAGLAGSAQAADPLGFQAYQGVRVTGENPKTPPASTPVAYSGVPLVLSHSYIGRDAAEPMIAVDKAGAVFFSAGAFDAMVPGTARQELRRSLDNGRTWERVDAPFFTGQGEFETLDPYVYNDYTTGRVFAVTLLGGGSYLAWTDDSGKTWTESAMSSPGVNDHQSLTAHKPPAGFVGPATSDTFPNIVYYCVNHVSDARCTRSSDGGQTFVPTGGAAYLQPGEGEEGQNPGICSTLHGHLAGDEEGRIFLPAGHCGLATVAISEDAGLTWQRKIISQQIRSATTHTAVAADRAGNVYYVWFDPQHKLPYLSVSTDKGQSWSDPLMIAPPGVHEVNFPMITAGEAGRIAITFPGSTYKLKRNAEGEVEDDFASQRPWFSYVVTSTDADTANPTFLSNTAGPRNDPVHRGNCGPGRCGNMFDFLDIIISPTDGSIWASATDTCTPSNDCHLPDGTGSTDAEGVAIHQVGGPKMVGEGSFGAPAPGVMTPGPTVGGPSPAIARQPSAPPAKKVKLTCRRSGKAARCGVRLAKAPSGTSVALRLFKNDVLIGGGSAKLKKGRGSIRIKGAKGKAIKKGAYTVLVTVARKGTTPTRADRRLKLK